MYPWDHSARASALAEVDAERRRLDENREQEREEWAANAAAIRAEARRQSAAQELIAAALEKLTGITCPEGPPAPKPADAGTGADTSGDVSLVDALAEIDDILSSFGQLGKELVTFTQIADGTKHSEAVPKPADEIVYGALRRVRALKRRQADAIKAAVASERERCLAWLFADVGRAEVYDRIRSGAGAPGGSK